MIVTTLLGTAAKLTINKCTVVSGTSLLIVAVDDDDDDDGGAGCGQDDEAIRFLHLFTCEYNTSVFDAAYTT